MRLLADSVVNRLCMTYTGAMHNGVLFGQQERHEGTPQQLLHLLPKQPSLACNE